MQFWLMQENDYLWLPVPPPEFSIQKGRSNSIVNVEDFGEIALIGGKKLAPISISSFFPAREYSFCQTKNIRHPYACVELIEAWIESKKPIGFMISETNINMLCTIENFTYGEKDGTGDVYFTIDLKEYKILNTETYNENSAGERIGSKKKPSTYTVKEGDTLMLIAKMCVGNSNLWESIYKKNKNVIGSDPSLINPGQVLKL
ncbi:LysM peptidoglycan-binding domain-containing protein [Clostridium tagluense]|uniref:LysM peptidoglycan-binding domain-containing protein n=1 Tax=Clostridium tagluense TaxID=360422 RepID=UPI001C6EB010|nr:LysM peptidoglycan-binding domain-containing protein [Clostridium tagluense]MBW9159343.1 LysM peptidoglycan-binding domain-containing protein [Clostridium tagluense]WLC68082.1 LysM peptidoglycan-binding domain-containing protein [Clostridium tagluense]